MMRMDRLMRYGGHILLHLHFVAIESKDEDDEVHF